MSQGIYGSEQMQVCTPAHVSTKQQLQAGGADCVCVCVCFCVRVSVCTCAAATLAQTLVLVTSQGLETFNILPGMTNARLARHIRVTVSRFWYLPAERFLTLATGKNGHTLRSFLLLEGPPLRLPRVQLPTAVSPSNVFVCCLYKELFIGVLQAGWLSLREISRERVQQARSYELQQLDLSADAAGTFGLVVRVMPVLLVWFIAVGACVHLCGLV